MREKTVSFGDVELFTESFGNESDPTILLIMGSASSLLWWDESFCRLLVERGFRVIRYDHRDTGKSTCYPPGNPGYALDDMADDAIRILDAYGIEQAIMMGMSLGGVLAQIIALRYPRRTAGAVLLAAKYMGPGWEELPDMSREVSEFLQSLGSVQPETEDEMVELALRQWTTTNNSPLPKDYDYIRQMIHLDAQRAKDYNSRINHNIVPIIGDELTRVAQISAPTLVIHGTEDVVIPYPHGQKLAAAIPQAELLTMERAGHELHSQFHKIVADSIQRQFL